MQTKRVYACFKIRILVMKENPEIQSDCTISESGKLIVGFYPHYVIHWDGGHAWKDDEHMH